MVPEVGHYSNHTTKSEAVQDALKLIEQIKAIRCHPLLSGLHSDVSGLHHSTDSLASARDGRVVEGSWISHTPDQRATANEVLAVGADPLAHIADYVQAIQTATLREMNTRLDPKTVKSRAFFDHVMRGISEIALQDARPSDSCWSLDRLAPTVYDLASILFEAAGHDANREASASNNRTKQWVKQHKEWLISMKN